MEKWWRISVYYKGGIPARKKKEEETCCHKEYGAHFVLFLKQKNNKQKLPKNESTAKASPGSSAEGVRICNQCPSVPYRIHSTVTFHPMGFSFVSACPQSSQKECTARFSRKISKVQSNLGEGGLV